MPGLWRYCVHAGVLAVLFSDFLGGCGYATGGCGVRFVFSGLGRGVCTSTFGKPASRFGQGGQIASAQCAACHGAEGNSAAPTYPKLAGQHADYLYKQLKNFKIAEGADKALRENAIMAGFAAGLSEQDMRNVAAYFAAQKTEPGFAGNKATLAQGQAIYQGGIAEKGVPACAACHSPNGAGIPAQYPRLGGQHAEYTSAQLTAFREGLRTNSEPMITITSRLSDAEIKALADYIAGLH
ncbi:MAG: cytochrome c4 [Limnobacter sp.]|nr:cytochrome c4 [Limnobacter sp.]